MSFFADSNMVRFEITNSRKQINPAKNAIEIRILAVRNRFTVNPNIANNMQENETHSKSERHFSFA